MTFRSFKLSYENYPLEDLRKAWISSGNQDPYRSSLIVRLAILVMTLSISAAAFLFWLIFNQPDSDLYQQHFAGQLDIYLPALLSISAVAAVAWMMFRVNCQRFMENFVVARNLLRTYQIYMHKKDIHIFVNWKECAEIAMDKASKRRAYLSAIANLNADDLRCEPDLKQASEALKKFGCLENKSAAN